MRNVKTFQNAIQELSNSDKINAKQFFNALFDVSQYRTKRTGVENSVQLVFQLALIIHRYFWQPVDELEVSKYAQMIGIETSTFWQFKNTISIVGAIASAFTTFRQTLLTENMMSYIEDSVPLGITKSIIKCLLICLSLSCNIFITLLVIFHLLNDQRWNNRRERLINLFGGERQYGAFVGLILFLFCPLICSLQKFITGVIQNMASSGAKFKQTIKLAWDVFHYQTVLDMKYSRLHLGKSYESLPKKFSPHARTRILFLGPSE